VLEPASFLRRSDADVADAPTLARVEVTEYVHAALHPARTTVDALVTECVCQPLHRMAGSDRVAVEMQLAMDLHEAHRTTVAREHRETSRTQMAAPQRVRVRGLGRDGRRAAPMRHAEAVNDVLRFDAWPHDNSELRELRPDGGELAGKRSLLFIERRRLVQKRGALGVERGELARAVRHAAITHRVFDRRHSGSPTALRSTRGSTHRTHARQMRDLDCAAI
jgi:hypothetical protein